MFSSTRASKLLQFATVFLDLGVALSWTACAGGAALRSGRGARAPAAALPMGLPAAVLARRCLSSVSRAWFSWFSSWAFLRSRSFSLRM
uniref:Uncharacterized protein n=1 Tax=Triticum urartu TaxID=4572 RepID=A0A8R7PFW0_TRIUA